MPRPHGANPVADVVRAVLGSPSWRTAATGRPSLTSVTARARHRVQATSNWGQRNPSNRGCLARTTGCTVDPGTMVVPAHNRPRPQASSDGSRSPWTLNTSNTSLGSLPLCTIPAMPPAFAPATERCGRRPNASCAGCSGHWHEPSPPLRPARPATSCLLRGRDSLTARICCGECRRPVVGRPSQVAGVDHP